MDHILVITKRALRRWKRNLGAFVDRYVLPWFLISVWIFICVSLAAVIISTMFGAFAK